MKMLNHSCTFLHSLNYTVVGGGFKGEGAGHRGGRGGERDEGKHRGKEA